MVRNPLDLFTLLGAAGIGALGEAAGLCIAYAAGVFCSPRSRGERVPARYLSTRLPGLCRARAPAAAAVLGWPQADQLIIKLFLLIAIKALAGDWLRLPLLPYLR